MTDENLGGGSVLSNSGPVARTRPQPVAAMRVYEQLIVKKEEAYERLRQYVQKTYDESVQGRFNEYLDKRKAAARRVYNLNATTLADLAIYVECLSKLVDDTITGNENIRPLIEDKSLHKWITLGINHMQDKFYDRVIRKNVRDDKPEKLSVRAFQYWQEYPPKYINATVVVEALAEIEGPAKSR